MEAGEIEEEDVSIGEDTATEEEAKMLRRISSSAGMLPPKWRRKLSMNSTRASRLLISNLVRVN